MSKFAINFNLRHYSVEEFNWVADAVRTGAKHTDMWVKCYDNQEDTRSAPAFHFKCNNRGRA